ncbi:MAG TPA: hypothetical protein VK660_01140 [Xanthomonadaceae bacterium]|nr:hypothetical protein [Xanthomonadaceae bacterium]
MTGNLVRTAVPAFAGQLCVAVLMVFVAGCSSIPPLHVEPPPVVSEAPHAAPDFTIAAGMLDTWNAVGQIVVRLDGVTYQSRAQMLGIYEVSYRGERFLIVTRAMVIDSQAQGMSTKVSVVLPDGKPDESAAAIEVLGILQVQLPDELRKIAAGKGNSKRRKR